MYSGRLNRKQYFISLVCIVVGWIAVYVGTFLLTIVNPYLSLVWLLVTVIGCILLTLSVQVRRLHDIGISGYIALIVNVLFIALLIALPDILFARTPDYPAISESGPMDSRIFIAGWGFLHLLYLVYVIGIGILKSSPKAGRYGPTLTYPSVWAMLTGSRK